MLLDSPVWLLALLPWGLVVFYLLPGSGTPAAVPFIKLWKPAGRSSRWYARRWPGVATVLMLSALLLAVLIAAKPRFGGLLALDGDCSIILDRGATMAAPAASGRLARGVVQRCLDRVTISAQSNVSLIPVPGRSMQLMGDSWMHAADELPATALPVNLTQTIENQLRTTTGSVLVLSDQPVEVKNPRIIQILPEKPADLVAITALGARRMPRPQVMLRVENHSDLSSIDVSIHSGKTSMVRRIELPHRGSSTDQFIDLPELQDTVAAELQGDTSGNPWAAAFAVSAGHGLLLQVDPTLDEAVRRIAAVYQNDRPRDGDAMAVTIGSGLPIANQSGVWLNTATVDRPAKWPAVDVAGSELTQNVTNWPDPIAGARLPADFVPLVSTGKDVVLAIRDGPARAVWLNADLSRWKQTTDFVIFWANALDWISINGDRFISTTPGELGDGWMKIDGLKTPKGLKAGEWAGIYAEEKSDRLLAISAGAYEDHSQNIEPAIAGALRHSSIGWLDTARRSLTSVITFSSIALVLVALLKWPSSSVRTGCFPQS